MLFLQIFGDVYYHFDLIHFMLFFPERYFSAFVCFLLFNAGDWGGRSIAGSIQIVSEITYIAAVIPYST